MDFKELVKEIRNCSDKDFQSSANVLEDIIFNLSKTDTINLISEIGTIPENIGHDSSEEKIYTKVSDILFAKALKEMGFSVQVLKERADCADIIVQSKFHKYSFVGDAKTFRLSRTAKNQKDFKINSMDHWRGDCNFSVLTCPYFQYPKSSSQIYKDALNKNVALFSWEYLYILLKENVKESRNKNLMNLWNQSAIIAENTTVNNSKQNFLDEQNKNFIAIVGINEKKFNRYFSNIKTTLINRGQVEIEFYESEINRIRQLSRKDAIDELLTNMKLDNKINTIRQFINQIEK